MDNAGGVPGEKWFVAIVKHNAELAVSEDLAKDGYTPYVAYQRLPRVWRNGRKAYVNKVVLPSLVFVRCTEAMRRRILKQNIVSRFMTNRAAKTPDMLTAPVAVISQREIDTLRFMLGQSDIPVDIVETKYSLKDRVEVIRGPLKGLVGEVLELDDDQTQLVVALDLLGSARMSIRSIDLRILPPPEYNSLVLNYLYIQTLIRIPHHRSLLYCFWPSLELQLKETVAIC